jgi:peptidoglycan/xylan/chitin deacetylase (PgdA/CDA1 family)
VIARRLRGRRLRHSSAFILLYHRVSEEPVDPWGLGVTPEHFASQLQTLGRSWRVVPLDELLEAVRARDVPPRSVAITFDDGYADNLERAAPALVEQGVAATLFPSTGFVDSPREPWWDELLGLVLEPPRLPDSLSITTPNGSRSWRVPPPTTHDRPPHVSRVRPWNAVEGTRLHAYYQVWRELRSLSREDREQALDEIAVWAGAPRTRPPRHRLLTRDELATFRALPGMAIGCHTVTHPTLPECSPEQRQDEITESRGWLRHELGVEPLDFAYPFGDFDPDVAGLVERLGFRSGLAVARRPVSDRSSLFALPRVPVDDRPGRELARHLLRLSWSLEARAPG